MVQVTKTYLPAFETYAARLKPAWDKGWITNNGELVQELEASLKSYLGVKHLLLCSNGTVVLDMALRALDITGEVITTPFSYVATANAIAWRGCQPVFVDIDPESLCIDPQKIEASITGNTQAILATHVFGRPCDIERLQQLADQYGLKLIFDGAHAFGSRYNGQSLLSFGDVSTCSFHATKLFHMVEGGCLVCDDDALAEKLLHYRQFGHIYDDYYDIGINAKNSELHAAMGLCVMDVFPELLESRKKITAQYQRLLTGTIVKPVMADLPEGYNYAYFPVLLPNETILLELRDALIQQGIVPRRYFYPSLNTLAYMPGRNSCPVSEDIASRILCLPLFHDLDQVVIATIADTIKQLQPHETI